MQNVFVIGGYINSPTQKLFNTKEARDLRQVHCQGHFQLCF